MFTTDGDNTRGHSVHQRPGWPHAPQSRSATSLYANAVITEHALPSDNLHFSLTTRGRGNDGSAAGTMVAVEGEYRLPPLDENRTSSSNDRLPSLQALGIFDAPSARFAWPGLQASSQMSSAPLITMDTSHSRPNTTSCRHMYDHYRENTNSPPPSRGSSAFLLRNVDGPGHHYATASWRRGPCDGPGHMTLSQHLSGTPPASLDHDGAETSSVTSDDEDDHESVEDRGYSIVRTGRDDTPDLWKKYAAGERRQMYCVWVTEHGTTCEDSEDAREDHRVRRHIEAVHLAYKPYQCNYCEAAFSQKGSIERHVSTHTGLKLLICKYCDARFNDGSRRHRHMVSVHDHKPKPRKLKQRRR